MIGIIVQARMGSTRLPGKAMREVMGRPLLAYQLERLQRVKSADPVIVATTQLEEEAPIIELCKKMGIQYYCGSQNDLLQRYLDASEAFNLNTIIRSTGDCPLIDPKIVEKGLQFFQSANVDYVSNTVNRTYPRGMDVEIFSSEALIKADKLCRDPSLREHATPPFYLSNEFAVSQFTDIENHSNFRLTVDTEEDFLLIRQIIEALYPKNPSFSLNEIIELLQKHPEWSKINEHVMQKKLGAP